MDKGIQRYETGKVRLCYILFNCITHEQETL